MVLCSSVRQKSSIHRSEKEGSKLEEQRRSRRKPPSASNTQESTSSLIGSFQHEMEAAIYTLGTKVYVQFIDDNEHDGLALTWISSKRGGGKNFP
jgi:type IV secretory pathway VirB9-like protein